MPHGDVGRFSTVTGPTSTLPSTISTRRHGRWCIGAPQSWYRSTPGTDLHARSLASDTCSRSAASSRAMTTRTAVLRMLIRWANDSRLPQSRIGEASLGSWTPITHSTKVHAEGRRRREYVLGHTSVATTADVSMHVTPAMWDRLADRMDAMLGAWAHRPSVREGLQ